MYLVASDTSSGFYEKIGMGKSATEDKEYFLYRGGEEKIHAALTHALGPDFHYSLLLTEEHALKP